MQTAGRVVGAGAELAAGVQLGEDHLDARTARSAARCRPGCRGPGRATEMPPSARSVTKISRPKPPRASSTALSMISHRQCISPRVSVDPMYIAGRLRTASRPSRTSRCRAS